MTIAEQRREAQRMIEIEALFEYETFKDKGRDFLTALEKVPYIGLIFCPNWSQHTQPGSGFPVSARGELIRFLFKLALAVAVGAILGILALAAAFVFFVIAVWIRHLPAPISFLCGGYFWISFHHKEGNAGPQWYY